MKVLLITRHAKSSWDQPSRTDFDRPLNERGLEDAPRMGKLLKDNRLTPGLILSSKARRAVETAQIIAEHSGYTGKIKFVEDLYQGGAGVYLEAIKKEAGNENPVMIIGHNPDVEILIKGLTGRNEKMPTAAVAQIILPVDEWKELSDKTTGTLEHIWKPKELD